MSASTQTQPDPNFPFVMAIIIGGIFLLLYALKEEKPKRKRRYDMDNPFE